MAGIGGGVGLGAVVPLLALGLHAHAMEPEHGDLVFQSLPHGALIDAIETASRSPFSHCGIVVVGDRGTTVLEAIGPVRHTAWQDWVGQGRDGRYLVCRLRDQGLARGMVEAAERFLGRPYDIHYTLDDERIYCSELIYKALLHSAHLQLARPTRLRDLDWQAIQPVIRAIEGGEVPLDREIVTPVSLVYAGAVRVVFSNYAGR